MASESGKLKDYEGQDMESFFQNYNPADDENSYEEEEVDDPNVQDIENVETSK